MLISLFKWEDTRDESLGQFESEITDKDHCEC